jgi:hypothetical protein
MFQIKYFSVNTMSDFVATLTLAERFGVVSQNIKFHVSVIVGI